MYPHNLIGPTHVQSHVGPYVAKSFRMWHVEINRKLHGYEHFFGGSSLDSSQYYEHLCSHPTRIEEGEEESSVKERGNASYQTKKKEKEKIFATGS